MKLLILDENYPHLENLMGDVFVHVRAKEYALQNEVSVYSFFHQKEDLLYEGISVRFFEDANSLADAIHCYQPDKILIHFYQSWMLDAILKRFKVPTIIWVHGYEALGWYRRLFNYTLYSPVFFNFIKKNTYQQWHFRKMIQYTHHSGLIKFVFVSDWMRKITEMDTLSRISQKYIIPNPIDTELFEYKEKNVELRKSILLLRSFGTRKYANDISVNAILLLSKKPFFNDLNFTLTGTGSLFNILTTPLKKFSNVKLNQSAVRQVNIPSLHKHFGIFLCPTRQDAQGVSMCEAMSSGLVPITSNNTAIPEFVENDKTGYLTNSAKAVAEAIEDLYFHPEKFLRMSKAASESVRKKCNIKKIVEKELIIIQN